MLVIEKQHIENKDYDVTCVLIHIFWFQLFMYCFKIRLQESTKVLSFKTCGSWLCVENKYHVFVVLRGKHSTVCVFSSFHTV